MMQSRTHTCNELRMEHVGQQVKIVGWMENIRDWCISRQLWWGHQIPAWYCDECGHINVSREDPTKCEKCGSTLFRKGSKLYCAKEVCGFEMPVPKKD